MKLKLLFCYKMVVWLFHSMSINSSITENFYDDTCVNVDKTNPY